MNGPTHYIVPSENCSVIYLHVNNVVYMFINDHAYVPCLCCLFRCLQAQQDVEMFLEQAAEEAVGSSYGPAGGRFASKDVRVSV